MEELKEFDSIDGYIKLFPKHIQDILEKIRQIIKEASPEAKEAINYQIPTFRLKGKNLAHFAVWKTHIGFYPTPTAIEKFKDELSAYKISKGSIQFPLKSPIPYDLIKRIVIFRKNSIENEK